MIDRRRQSSILDVRSFRGADCDTDHYLVFAKVRERLAVSKQEALKLDGEKFNLRTLKDLEVTKQYQIEITKRFSALGNISDDEDIWENIKENIKTSAKESLVPHELKKQKPLFFKLNLPEMRQSVRGLSAAVWLEIANGMQGIHPVMYHL